MECFRRSHGGRFSRRREAPVTRVDRKCEIGRYGRMRKICGPLYGMEAHHIVPDWTLRYGGRDDSSKRIQNMPSLLDGNAICVTGNARTSGTEHNEAHFADSAIESRGVGSSPPGTARVQDVVRDSVAAMTAVRPDCASEIVRKAREQFGQKDQNQLLRAVQRIDQTPLHPDTVGALSSGASHPWSKGGP